MRRDGTPFLAAVAYPTMREAAQALGINQSALVIQINRLEQDLGQPLLERAERGRAMKPTPFGKRVATAIRKSVPDRKHFAQAGEGLLPSRQRERRVITGQGG
ncbi:LysR family transcriptional regulator [Streptomyces olivoreticuli]